MQLVGIFNQQLSRKEAALTAYLHELEQKAAADVFVGLAEATKRTEKLLAADCSQQTAAEKQALVVEHEFDDQKDVRDREGDFIEDFEGNPMLAYMMQLKGKEGGDAILDQQEHSVLDIKCLEQMATRLLATADQRKGVDDDEEDDVDAPAAHLLRVPKPMFKDDDAAEPSNVDDLSDFQTNPLLKLLQAEAGIDENIEHSALDLKHLEHVAKRLTIQGNLSST